MSPGEREAAELLVLVICIALPLGAVICFIVTGLRVWALRRQLIREGRRLHGGA